MTMKDFKITAIRLAKNGGIRYQAVQYVTKNTEVSLEDEIMFGNLSNKPQHLISVMNKQAMLKYFPDLEPFIEGASLDGWTYGLSSVALPDTRDEEPKYLCIRVKEGIDPADFQWIDKLTGETQTRDPKQTPEGVLLTQNDKPIYRDTFMKMMTESQFLSGEFHEYVEHDKLDHA